MTHLKLATIVATWQDRLGLGEWEIDIELDSPADEGNDAQIRAHDHYDHAVIRFNEDWTTWDKTKANRLVVHELLHLLHRDLDQVFESFIGHVARDTYSMANDRYHHELEGFIDRMSVRLADLRPV